MLIHSLDLNQRSGWAIGPAGKVPNSGFLVLRKKDQSITHAVYNLRCYLEATWGKVRPDHVAFEAPMTIAAWLQNAKKHGGQHNPQSFEHAIKLCSELEATAYGYGIPCTPIYRTAIMWQVTERGTWGSYENNKKAIIRCLVQQGMLPPGCTDNDRADAVAAHVVASGKFAKNKHSTFGLFAEID